MTDSSICVFSRSFIRQTNKSISRLSVAFTCICSFVLSVVGAKSIFNGSFCSRFFSLGNWITLACDSIFSFLVNWLRVERQHCLVDFGIVVFVRQGVSKLVVTPCFLGVDVDDFFYFIGKLERNRWKMFSTGWSWLLRRCCNTDDGAGWIFGSNGCDFSDFDGFF